ncbi:hypothetical protein CVT24_000973 [Panaeolus cyanescens]|uniref:Uncharacterized protein n=1 Tax=Panaeolus cyanescens TaxID=181874 RepID=A0A409YCF1_9AGAR|nr:hypothetical protein CVT24_000973 [Panaeolus cyanescens]
MFNILLLSASIFLGLYGPVSQALAVPFETEALSSLRYNFRLAAVNSTLPNSNSTGVPLVLGQGGESFDSANGATSGLYFYVTSTYASYPYNEYPSLALVNKELHAFTRSGQWITNATEVRNGTTLGWVSTTIYTAPAPQVYTALKNASNSTQRYPILAAHGVSDLWSLCTFHGTYPQNNVVYNVSAAIEQASAQGAQPLPFDAESCYEVLINIVPASF